MRSALQSPKKQAGYVGVVTAMAIVTVLGVALVVTARMQRDNAQVEAARIMGQQVSQVASALRSFITAAQSDTSLVSSSARTGVDWLKSPTCGGLSTNPTDGYLPCSFNGGMYEDSFSTTMTYTSSTAYIESRTSFQVPVTGDSEDYRKLLAARVVKAALASQNIPNTNTFFSAFANAAASATSQPTIASDTEANAGRIVLVVSNAASNDPWLRVDGTNAMGADLNMGGYSIVSANAGTFTGNLTVGGTATITGAATLKSSIAVTGVIQGNSGLTLKNGTADLQGGLVTTDAYFSDTAAYASEAISHAQVLTGSSSYTVTKPTCGSNASTKEIFTGFQGTGTNSSADSIYEARIDVTDNSTYWTVKPVLTAKTYAMAQSGTTVTFTKTAASTNPTDARIVVLTKCSG